MKNKDKYIVLVLLLACLLPFSRSMASSHREAPLISNDPLADNTDLYAFRSPCDTNKIVLIANYIPFEHPAGGPNWYTFGENIRYEIHLENNGITGDDITYRFTFTRVNQAPTTFFNIRLGQQNIKTTYKCEKSVNGGAFTTIVASGTVPPPNIGPRSIESSPVGLGATSYNDLVNASVAMATGSGGEKIFCGPSDDPFFVDLGGAFDVGGFRATGKDGLAKFNCHSIVIEVPIATLQKNGQPVTAATNILDGNYVVGVWASASRPQMTTLSTNGTPPTTSGSWVQVSRLGMPLTNEAVIPLGMKDKWNSLTPYNEDPAMEDYFCNPELALYMDNSLFGGAVPGLAALRIQRNSLQAFDFGNGQNGLWVLHDSNAGAGTALDTNLFGNYLLRPNKPRSVDILPIFYTGVPNLAPYQLATGKNGNPLAVGKPFINNFLPTFGDMLRLNMAVPVTPRNHAQFSSLGIIQAAVLGLTVAPYNANAGLQWIPNMDGFPNGRRLEDDVTTIELQAVSGAALAAIGLWYDDYTAGGPNPVTTDLLDVLTFNAGVTHNDTTFKACFPYLQNPWRGFNGPGYVGPSFAGVEDLGLSAPNAVMIGYPNPFMASTTFRYKINTAGKVNIQIYGITGTTVATFNEGNRTSGEYTVNWDPGTLAAGIYQARLFVDGKPVQTVKMVKSN